MKEGMLKGADVPIGKGEIDWARVCQQLRAVGFNDWATAEVRGGDQAHLADVAAQMNQVLSL